MTLMFGYGGYTGMENEKVNYDECFHAFSDRVVLITGGARGIGLSCAKEFLKCGAKVIITGRKQASLEAAKAEMESDNVRLIKWDISDLSILSEKVDQAIGFFGKIDILINNAGVDVTTDGRRFGEWFDFTEKDYDHVLNTNLKAPVFLTRELVRRWIKNNKDSQHIVNVCSGCAYKPAKYPYGLSKWGLRAFTQGVGREFARNGIIINGIAPGATLTDMIQDKDGDKAVDEGGVPAGRCATPDEVAKAIVFLASNLADYLVGEVIRFDGGYSFTVLGGE